jgi:hypothetical protein
MPRCGAATGSIDHLTSSVPSPKAATHKPTTSIWSANSSRAHSHNARQPRQGDRHRGMAAGRNPGPQTVAAHPPISRPTRPPGSSVPPGPARQDTRHAGSSHPRRPRPTRVRTAPSTKPSRRPIVSSSLTPAVMKCSRCNVTTPAGVGSLDRSRWPAGSPCTSRTRSSCGRSLGSSAQARRSRRPPAESATEGPARATRSPSPPGTPA